MVRFSSSASSVSPCACDCCSLRGCLCLNHLLLRGQNSLRIASERKFSSKMTASQSTRSGSNATPKRPMVIDSHRTKVALNNTRMKHMYVHGEESLHVTKAQSRLCRERGTKQAHAQAQQEAKQEKTTRKKQKSHMNRGTESRAGTGKPQSSKGRRCSVCAAFAAVCAILPLRKRGLLACSSSSRRHS